MSTHNGIRGLNLGLGAQLSVLLCGLAFAACPAPKAEENAGRCTDGHFAVEFPAGAPERDASDGAMGCAQVSEDAFYLFWSFPAEYMSPSILIAALPSVIGDPSPQQEDVLSLPGAVRLNVKGARGDAAAIVVTDSTVVTIALVIGKDVQGNLAVERFFESFKSDNDKAALKSLSLKSAIGSAISALHGGPCIIDDKFAAQCKEHAHIPSMLCSVAKVAPYIGEPIADICKTYFDESRLRTCNRGNCGENELCLNGVCCTAGYAQCGGTCYLPQHCQICVNDSFIVSACNDCETCEKSVVGVTPGECKSRCEPGQSCCFGECSTLQDSKNCGACGISCGSDACCLGECTDTSTTINCGACGKLCPSGQKCFEGKCGCLPCSTWDAASHKCVEDCDPFLCKACGLDFTVEPPAYNCQSTCIAGEVCWSGVCIDGFPDAWIGTAEVTDVNNDYTAHAQVTWKKLTVEDGIVYYIPEGTLDVTVFSDACSTVVDSAAIAPDISLLSINSNDNPPTYLGYGSGTNNVTVDCPGIPTYTVQMGPFWMYTFESKLLTSDVEMSGVSSGQSMSSKWSFAASF